MKDSSKNNKLVIVANRLPFNIKRSNGKLAIVESDGGLVSALRSYLSDPASVEKFSEIIWIGTAPFTESVWHKYLKEENATSYYRVLPLFIDKNNYNRFYNGFCNSTLWPLFHYFPSMVEFTKNTFPDYVDVNESFADVIEKIIAPNDIVWVHDYQLMLLPALIRKKVPNATIGFFLHIPFPSFEVFRLLHRSWKERIVAGLLGADIIGFHTHQYVQHFLKTVQMTTGHDYSYRNIFLTNRVVRAEMFPLGIDFSKFQLAAGAPQVARQKESIHETFKGKKIIFSVDRLDYTKGITHRLAGFELFLSENPQWLGQLVFILVVVPSRQIISKYNDRKRLIEEEIGRINGKYSTLNWQPIIYRYSQLSFDELVALYSTADVALITPLRDGMNLVAKEFIATKRQHGVLILSELAGAASELSEAILVNPLDRQDVSRAILDALMMPQESQAAKISSLQRRLKTYTVVDWVDDFLTQLDEIKSEQRNQETRHLVGPALSRLVVDYKHAYQRLLLLDYDGTLAPYAKRPENAAPTDDTLRILTALSSSKDTHVAIVSGRDSSTLEKWFGTLPITLVSEHGAAVKMRTEHWSVVPTVEQNAKWKEIVRPTLEIFYQRTPGAFIEEKRFTLVWHYRNTEKELGFIRSRELLDNLHHLLRNTQLRIVDGNKVIEIHQNIFDKGVVAQTLLSAARYDFILAMGDDKTDEDMFRAVGSSGYTVRVGTSSTHASFFLLDHHESLKLLETLIES